MWNLKKHNKLVNIRKKKRGRLTDTESKAVVTRGGGKGTREVGERGAQPAGCETGSRMYCTTGGILPIFHNN